MKFKKLIKLMKYYDWHIVIDNIDIAYYNFGNERFVGTPSTDGSLDIDKITRKQLLNLLILHPAPLKFWGMGKTAKFIRKFIEDTQRTIRKVE